MKKMGIKARYRKPNTSRRHAAHPIHPYLLRNLVIDRPNQVWATDITYIPMRRGFVYLVAVMDWHSRRVLSWRLSNTLTTDFSVWTRCGRSSRNMACRRSSTPIKAASSPAETLPTCSRSTASPSAWAAKAAGATTCSSSASGRA